MKTRTLVIGVSSAIALLGAGLAWRARQAAPVSPVIPSVAPAVVAAEQQVRAGCRFAVGTDFAFTYRSQTHYSIVTALPGAPEPMTQTGSTELAGLLHAQVLEANADSVTVLARLAHVNEQAKKLGGEEVEAPFLAKVSPGCEVTAFARHQKTPRVAARAQQVALHDLAFSVVDGAPQERTFMTSMGTLRALVAPSNDGAGRFVRKPLNYVGRWSPRMADVELVDGVVEVERHAGGWLEVLHGVERLAGGPVTESTTEWDVRRVDAQPEALASSSRLLADYVWENVLAQDAEEEHTKLAGNDENQRRRIEAARSVSWDQALARFQLLINSGANINEQWRDMSAFLETHPEQIPEFVELITDDEFPPGAGAPAFLALGQVQSPVAREALLGIYNDPELRPVDRIRSSLALVGRKDVGAPLARLLRKEATRTTTTAGEATVARQTVLHLGILAGSHPGQADIGQESMALVQQLTASAKTPEDYSVLCGMVGNMAELALLPQIATWSRMEDPQLRRQVPQALRRYRVDRTHELLVEWLARETDFDVKRELFNLLHHSYVDAQQPIDAPLVSEAVRHLREKPLPLTRQSIYHLLAAHVDEPEVHALLKSQLKYELEEKSGLYSLVAQYLPAQSVSEVLSTFGGMQAQFGGTLKPRDPVAAPAPTTPFQEGITVPSNLESLKGGMP